jgi:hypothetical protein
MRALSASGRKQQQLLYRQAVISANILCSIFFSHRDYSRLAAWKYDEYGGGLD